MGLFELNKRRLKPAATNNTNSHMFVCMLSIVDEDVIDREDREGDGKGRDDFASGNGFLFFR